MGGGRFVKSFYNRVAKASKDPRRSAASPPPSTALCPPGASPSRGRSPNIPFLHLLFSKEIVGREGHARLGVNLGTKPLKDDILYLQLFFPGVKRSAGLEEQKFQPRAPC